MGLFAVDLQRVRAVPGMLDRLAESATAGRMYAEQYFTFDLEPNRPERELITPPDYTEPYQPAFTDVVSPGS